ncbi:HD-GYP domain-containing protein, partial [Streptomyces sp. DT225]
DAFDAMNSTRSYRRGRPVPAAVEELKRCDGTQFDPQMVRALARGLERYGWSGAVTADDARLPPPREAAGEADGGRGVDAGTLRTPLGPRPQEPLGPRPPDGTEGSR